MPFAATWMDLEIIKLSEVSQKEKRYIPSDITYMWNLKYDTNDLIYETETGSQTQIRDLRLMGRWQGEVQSLGLADANYYIQYG